MSSRSRNTLFVAIAALLAGSVATALPASADEPLAPIRQLSSTPRESGLNFTGGKPEAYRNSTVAELKLARAQQELRHRLARIEANNWAGYSPGRPTLPANPFTQLRTPIYRPYHIWSVFDYGYFVR